MYLFFFQDPRFVVSGGGGNTDQMGSSIIFVITGKCGKPFFSGMMTKSFVAYCIIRRETTAGR
jgi:hypothetical protein